MDFVKTVLYNFSMKKILGILIFIAFCAGIFSVQSYVDLLYAKNKKYYVEKNLLITLPTNITKSITLGFDDFIADIAWLQFIQYYGENQIIIRSGSKDYDLSYIHQYIDVITTLDPEFSYAYWFGAFAIADDMNNPDLALKMLQKGIKNNPDNWWLPYTASVMELMYNNDFVGAVKFIDQAYKVRPNNRTVAVLRNVLHSKAPKQEKARLTWLEIYRNAREKHDTVTMERAVKKLKKLGYTLVEQ